MNRLLIVILGFVATAVGIAVFSIAFGPISQRSNAAPAVASVILQAMKLGYECRDAGRSIDECQQEQKDRWAYVARTGHAPAQ